MRFKFTLLSNAASLIPYVLQFWKHTKHLISNSTVKQNQMDPEIQFHTQALTISKEEVKIHIFKYKEMHWKEFNQIINE
jgi:hypothetical protein